MELGVWSGSKKVNGRKKMKSHMSKYGGEGGFLAALCEKSRETGLGQGEGKKKKKKQTVGQPGRKRKGGKNEPRHPAHAEKR